MVDTAGKVYYIVYKHCEKTDGQQPENVPAGTDVRPRYGQTKHGSDVRKWNPKIDLVPCWSI